MSAQRFTRLSCDYGRCTAAIERDGPFRTVREYAAKILKWDVGRSDFCPDHNTPSKRRPVEYVPVPWPGAVVNPDTEQANKIIEERRRGR